MVETIQSDWRDSIKILWKHKIMVKQARRARIFTITGYILTILCGSSFALLPLIGLSTRAIDNKTDPYEGRFLALQSCYPFDYGRTPIFELVFLTQTIATVFVSVSFCIPDNYFGVLIFHACGQFEILEKKTKVLLGIEDVNNLDYKQFKIKLGKIVETHVRLSR